jgi:hypothetical protein
LVEGSAASLIEPKGVMNVFWTVDAQTHQEVVNRKELRPLIVDEHTVGLEGMRNLLGRTSIFFP